MTQNRKRFMMHQSDDKETIWISDVEKHKEIEIQHFYGIVYVINELNALHEENTRLLLELDTHKHPLWSTREAERKVNELTELLANETKKNAILLEEINSLRIENMRLKKENNELKLMVNGLLEMEE